MRCASQLLDDAFDRPEPSLAIVVQPVGSRDSLEQAAWRQLGLRCSGGIPDDLPWVHSQGWGQMDKAYTAHGGLGRGGKGRNRVDRG